MIKIDWNCESYFFFLFLFKVLSGGCWSSDHSCVKQSTRSGGQGLEGGLRGRNKRGGDDSVPVSDSSTTVLICW